MKKSINNFCRVLVALILCTGIVFSGCTEGPLGENENEGESGPLTWSLDNVTEVSATFTGRLDVPAADLSFSKVTVCYSDAEVFNINDVSQVSATIFDADQKFTITVTGLKPNVKYNYCLIAEVKSEKIYGDVKNFTTVALVAPSLDVASATDLSSSASANCYIVSESGLYKFKTVKGNSTTSVGSVSSASILWETFGTDTTPYATEIVAGVCYEDGYIAFQTADTFKEGNAVVAAKDNSGNILWSWHIWLTDEPQGQEYYNNAGTMMDRNLGATSATPGDVGALGLLYQWGRKDPFLGSSSISDDIEAKSTITWPSSVKSNSSNGTIEYATAHPTTFILSNDTIHDWYYTGSSSADNTRWTTSETSKSIYDPCPVGWRVPNGGDDGVWSKALGSSSCFLEDPSLYDSAKKGMNFSGKFGPDQIIWYPASAFRFENNGSFHFAGLYGNYWSASPDSLDSFSVYSLYFYGPPHVTVWLFNSVYARAHGYSVRCLQE